MTKAEFWETKDGEDWTVEDIAPEKPRTGAVSTRDTTRGAQKTTYFAIHLDTGAIKIGRSADTARREYELGLKFGGNIEIIGSVGEHMAETALIGYLEPWSLGSEWFSPSYEVLSVVRACLDNGYSEGLKVAQRLVDGTMGIE